MNLFHGGRLATMPPKLLNEEGDLFLYRPLAFVSEMDCEKFSSALKFPIIPCDLCGSQDGLQRQQVKKLLNEWESRTPGRRQIMFLYKDKETKKIVKYGMYAVFFSLFRNLCILRGFRQSLVLVSCSGK